MKPKSPLNIALVAGGTSAEREVSLKGAKQVKEALLRLGHRVREYDPRDDGLVRLVQDGQGLDCAFLVLHGTFGEDGRIQGLLDMMGLPYQGAGVLGSALAMDKHIAKVMYERNGIPTPRWYLVSRDQGLQDPKGVALGLGGFPLMVKPRCEGSSIGMGVARDMDSLVSLVETALKWDEYAIIEEYIQGRELSCGVLEGWGDWTLPPIEIIPGEAHEFFDYNAKYTPGATKEICPAPVPTQVEEMARRLAKKAHEALCLKDYSRTDMIMAPTGELYVIETNTIPGMTETSLLPQEAKVAGLGFDELIAFLVDRALAKSGMTPP